MPKDRIWISTSLNEIAVVFLSLFWAIRMAWFALLISDILSDSLGDFGIELGVADGRPIHSLHGLSV